MYIVLLCMEKGISLPCQSCMQFALSYDPLSSSSATALSFPLSTCGFGYFLPAPLPDLGYIFFFFFFCQAECFIWVISSCCFNFSISQFVISPPCLPLKAGSHILSTNSSKLFQIICEDMNGTRINNGTIAGSLLYPSWGFPWWAHTRGHGLQWAFTLYHVHICAHLNLFCHGKNPQDALQNAVLMKLTELHLVHFFFPPSSPC